MRVASVPIAGERIAVAGLAILGASVAVIVLAGPGRQVALVAMVAVVLLTGLMARAGRVPNAAWFVLAAVYLLDAGGMALTAIGSPIPMVLVAALLPLPFAASALWFHPDTRARLFLLLPLVTLGLLAALSLAWSLDPEYGLRKLGLWLVTGLVPCAAMLVFASPTRPVAWRWIAVIAGIYAILLLLIGETTTYPGRIVFFGANPIWVARAVFVGVIVTVFGPFSRSIKVVLVVPMLVAGHLTDSLGPELGLILGVAAGGAETIRIAGLSRRRATLAWTTLALAAGSILLIILAVASAVPQTSIGPIANDPNVTSRLSYLDLAVRMLIEAPIFGSGFGGFAASGAFDLYPHDMMAEVGSELGLLGLGLVAAWLVLAFRGAARSPLLVGLVVATTTFSLFSGSIAGNSEFWIFTGIAVAMYPLRNRIRTPEPSP